MKSNPQIYIIENTEISSNFKTNKKIAIEESYTTIFHPFARTCQGKCGNNCCKKNKNKKCCAGQHSH